ncbi:enoyl-CoA hydratase [Bacillus sp. HMF5848]|uniref:enoyl-CoA hydratase n=1 Tax=Bacillus sp. HMF5848 TaxID=2495421 RepID=UPI000F7A01F1|nr:enoyl-CoA hydratase [Bacillus sp. HMF5848]RSK28078.1 enoyl-CoA hydratase [Bacillus sp. HMF5848]
MEFFQISVDENVATVTLQRPPANALASGVLLELQHVLDELKLREDVRVVLLRGEGKFFSAGADIKEFTALQGAKSYANLSKRGQQLFEEVEAFPKPIIATIHGAALGGGLELAMACHIRYVTEDAKLGLPELQLGIIPGFAGTQRLTKYVGTAKALEMMLTSEPISGIEAVQMGLATKAFPEETLVSEVTAIAKKMAKKSPLTTEAVIELVNFAKHQSYYDGVEREAELFGDIFTSSDAKEGVMAFIEKRQPTFTGK